MRLRWAVPVAVVFASVWAFAQEIVVEPSRPNPVYTLGEKPQWKLSLKDAQATELQYTLKLAGLKVISQGTLPLVDGSATLSAELPEPGTVLGDVRAKLADGKEIKTLVGAAVAPEQITPSLPKPDDFDAFWAQQIQRLESIPANPVLTPSDSGKPNVSYWTLTLDNINNTKVRGHLAKPAAPGKYPAMLVVQWAGVYALPRGGAIGRAAEGWLTLNISAHDLPLEESPEFYKKFTDEVKDYTKVGFTSRETSYFLRMFLGCYRAADYLAHHPEWDGKTLVVTGTSQGGLQTIVTAGLHPKVTAAMALVPAGCDLTASEAGRAFGWPYWGADKSPDRAKVMETGRYFDAVNFATRVKCPVLVGMGLVDTTCPASNVYAMINQLRVPKEVVVMPEAGHKGPHDRYMPREKAWREAIRSGAALPPAK